MISTEIYMQCLERLLKKLKSTFKMMNLGSHSKNDTYLWESCD
jgi:hypothetical protein